MKLVIALLLLQASTVQPAPAPAIATEERVRGELQAFVSELSAAIRDKDRAALARLYAPEFRWMHGFGNLDDREEQIAAIIDPAVRSEGVPPLDFGPDTTLIVEGNVAILRRMTAGGQRLFGTAIYVKRDGAWQLLQMQSTVVTPERTAIAVPNETLRSYVGRYRQSNGNTAEFTVEGQQLLVQFPNRPRWRLTPVEADTFFDSSNNRYQFARDPEGRVTGYSIRVRDGTEITAQREAALPQQ